MTRSRYKIFDNAFPHFLTCTIVGWLPVFTRSETVAILFDSLRFLQKEKGLQMFGYVVLENHLHLIPVERGYVFEPTHWRNSSARNYAGLSAQIEINTDWR